MRKRNRNLGFSLVELIVAFAILGIATLGIGSFYVSSARSSSSINSQSQLQNEAQLAMNQMKDLIVDAELGMNYKVVTNSGGYFVLSDSDSAVTGDITSKMLYIFKTDDAGQLIASLLKWEKDSQEIQFQEMAVDVSAVTSVEAIAPSAGSWELLAEGVDAFAAELDEDGDKVKLSASFISGKHSYSANDTISLRNKVLAGESSLAKMTEGINVVVQDKVTKATVNVNPSVVAPGGGCNLTKNIEGTGDLSGFGYKWLVATDAKMINLLSSDVADVSGDNLIIKDLNQITGSVFLQLIVDADKDANMTNDSDDVKSNIAELKIIKNIRVGIKDANASESDLAGPAPRYSTTGGVTYNMYVKFDTAASLSNAETRVKWSIANCSADINKDADDPDVTIDSDGKVVIDKYCKNGTFDVVATLAKNSSVAVTYRFGVTEEYEAADKLIISGPDTINRGDEAQYTVKLNGYSVSPSDVEWSIRGSSVNGITIGTSGVVTVERDVNWSGAYNLEVSAKLKRDPSVQCQTKEFSVPKVTITVNCDNSSLIDASGKINGTRGASHGFTAVVTGLKDYEVEWSFDKSVYNADTGKEVLTGPYMQRGDTKIEVSSSNQCKATLKIGKDEPGELWYINVNAELVDKAGYSSTVTVYTKPIIDFFIRQTQRTNSFSWTEGWVVVTKVVDVYAGGTLASGYTDTSEMICTMTGGDVDDIEWSVTGSGARFVGDILFTTKKGTITVTAKYGGVSKSINFNVK